MGGGRWGGVEGSSGRLRSAVASFENVVTPDVGATGERKHTAAWAAVVTRGHIGSGPPKFLQGAHLRIDRLAGNCDNSATSD